MANIYRSLLLLPALLLLAGSLNAQEDQLPPQYQLKALTMQEELQLMNLPELKMPPGYANRDLPAVVDNSTQPCMRPVFNQAGLSCGQAAGIAYGFTYEIDRARNLDASLLANQYPTHFAWNFMNGGNGWYGVSYLHSFQILKEYGMPNAVDYGGTLSYGGSQRWMSGYTEYYNGMHHRINEAYQIQGGTPEGLQVIKAWLHDHLEGSDVGGVCNFYAQYVSASHTLPAGTPEAGKYVITNFGSSANHAMTIVGYNDSIRWDYNGDGQYTNHLDITGDGVVNMRDWEIGGFKMVQSYGGVPNWGDQGYAYMMYKTIADPISSSGIWNHCVHVLDVKETCEPKLTARIILKHDWRGKVGVTVGLANNSAASHPEISFVYPIFDFQCSDQYMQGGTAEEDKTIEFGLDLSEILTYVEMDQDVKLFLQVVEKDPLNQGTGDVIHFSIYDHTSGGTEITSPQSNVPLNENDTTTLTLVHSFNFDRVHIVDETLPPAPPGQYYSHALSAAGGTPPYTWELDKTYAESHSSATFPNVTAVQLSPTNNNSGWATRSIDFDFPFYDSSYNDITVHVDGYLMFDEQLYPYPYFVDDKVLFEVTRNISPLMNQHQNIVSGAGQGLYYEGDSTYATFRWKTCIEGNTSQVLNYAVTLYPDGHAEFFYGSNAPTGEYLWVSGISDGDSYNHQRTDLSNKPAIPVNYKTTLSPYNYPDEMTLSHDGVFSGTPLAAYNAEEITFKVTDNNFISSKKTLQLSGNGIVVLDSISSGGNGVIEFGEMVLQTVMLTNIEDQPISDATMQVFINDPYVTLTDSTQSLGTLPVGTTLRFTDAFSFQVSPGVPDHHLIEISTEITSDTSVWMSTLTHYAYAAAVAISEVTVDDENHRLDPGDTTDITVSLLNSGGAAAQSVYAMLSTSDPDVTIHTGLTNIAYFGPSSQEEAVYNISIADDVLHGHIITFVVTMTGENGFACSDTFELAVGMFREDFETGDFSQFAWGCRGNRDWSIDPTMAWEGVFSAKSGPIAHSEESSLLLDFTAQEDGMVSFWAMVSCEDDTSANNNYDYLAFFIDGTEQGRWDGQTGWQYHEFAVEEGYHRLEWRYQKDHSVNRAYDAAWVDLISFPAPLSAGPELSVSPLSIEITLQPGELDYDTLYLTNSGPGEVSFEVDIAGAGYSKQSAVGSRQLAVGSRQLAVGSRQLVRDPQSSGRSMAGSTLVSNSEKVHTGKAYTWELRTYCASQDSEWTKDIYLELPEGIELIVASDFEGGSGGPLQFLGPVGNGVTSHWHGEDASGWGVVHPGETATAEITFWVHNYLQGNTAIHYEVHGDIYGATPHVISGELPVRNLGPQVEWLTTGISEGTIAGGITRPLVLTINTEGMADGQYQAWIIIGDNHFHETIIPVSLTVDTYLGPADVISPEHALTVFPNPFNRMAYLTFYSEKETSGHLTLSNALGKAVFSGSVQIAKGENTVTWDGKTSDRQEVPGGIYYGRLDAGRDQYFFKVIKSQ